MGEDEYDTTHVGQVYQFNGEDYRCVSVVELYYDKSLTITFERVIPVLDDGDETVDAGSYDYSNEDRF